MILVPHHRAPEVVQPGEASLHLPSALVPAKRPSILGLGSPCPVGCDHSDLPAFELPIEVIAIVSLVTDEHLGQLFHEARGQCLSHQLHFVGAGSEGPYGDRKTSSVCDDHDLGAFTSLSRADMEPPFLALEKVPSMKHSVISIFPRRFRSCANAQSTLSHAPS